MPEQGTLTYADFVAMFPVDNVRRELIDGELIVSASPLTRHQRLVGRIYNAFANYLEEHGGGEAFGSPLDTLLSDTNVVEPDVMFIPDRQADIITEKQIVGVPALMIEVVSESRYDRVRKRDLYARFGVPEYWIVDPDADRVEVYRHRRGAYGKPEIFEPGETLTLADLPGFSLDLTKLFRRESPQYR